MQIDLIGMSQMIGYPTQFPSVSMMDWTENKPNARFWVLKLIKDSFHSGDQLVDTTVDSGDVAAQAFVTPAGHKLLLANKRNRTVDNRIARRRQGAGGDRGHGDGRWTWA